MASLAKILTPLCIVRSTVESGGNVLVLGPWYSEFDGLPNTEQPFEIDASRLIAKLEPQQRSTDEYISNLNDALTVFAVLKDPSKWEIVWVSHANRQIVPPKEFVLLGHEPNYFVGDHFSPVMDSMFFPTWHGTDEQGQLFLAYFNQLNHNGLFPRANEAAEFLNFYVQNVPSEKIEDFEIIGVWTEQS